MTDSAYIVLVLHWNGWDNCVRNEFPLTCFREMSSFVLNTDTKQYETFLVRDLVWTFIKVLRFVTLNHLLLKLWKGKNKSYHRILKSGLTFELYIYHCLSCTSVKIWLGCFLSKTSKVSSTWVICIHEYLCISVLPELLQIQVYFYTFWCHHDVFLNFYKHF